jgi:formylglycine-generating enzyme required for sulfatase activity
LQGAPREGRNWFINKHGHTMLVLPVPGRFQIGSPDFEKGRDGLEELQEQSITYQFAISAHEVTIDQFQRFRDDPTREHPVGREAERPAVFVTWYDAANYCRWLGEQEDRNRQRCYPAGVNIDSMMEFPNECVMLPGYRLPTGHEWEYAARAGSVTSRYFGNSEEMLKLHSWYGSNSDDRNWPVGCLQPNRWGLFDIYGNATEWCDATMMVMGQTRWQVRGGGYRSTPRYLRSATVDLYPQVSFSYIGFRIAMTLAADDPEVQDRDRAR